MIPHWFHFYMQISLNPNCIVFCVLIVIIPCMLSCYNNCNSDSGPIIIIHLLRSVYSAGLLLCFLYSDLFWVMNSGYSFPLGAWKYKENNTFLHDVQEYTVIYHKKDVMFQQSSFDRATAHHGQRILWSVSYPCEAAGNKITENHQQTVLTSSGNLNITA